MFLNVLVTVRLQKVGAFLPASLPEFSVNLSLCVGSFGGADIPAPCWMLFMDLHYHHYGSDRITAALTLAPFSPFGNSFTVFCYVFFLLVQSFNFFGGKFPVLSAFSLSTLIGFFFLSPRSSIPSWTACWVWPVKGPMLCWQNRPHLIIDAACCLYFCMSDRVGNTRA